MKKLTSLLAFSSLVLILNYSLAFASEEPAMIRGVRPLGMGGAFVALSDDQNAFFYNPAGFTQRTGSLFTLFELPVSATNDSINFYNFYTDNKANLKNFDKLDSTKQSNLRSEIENTVSKHKTRLSAGFPNTNYLSSGARPLAWGFGIFDEVDVSLQYKNTGFIPSLSVQGKVDVIAATPFAHRFDSLPLGLPGKISFGANVKHILRGKIDETTSVIGLENISPQLQTGEGTGLDVGTLYQPIHQWNFGLQITDLGGTTIKYGALNAVDPANSRPAENSMIGSRWNIGTAYFPSKIYYWPGKYLRTEDRIVLLADIRDILSPDERVFSENFRKKFHVGAELRWGPLSFRGGFNAGTPTVGFGARLPYLGLSAEYVYWTDETATYVETTHKIAVAMRWGDAKGRPYGKNEKKIEEEAAKKEAKKAEPNTKGSSQGPLGIWNNAVHYDNGFTPAVAGVEKTNVVIEVHDGISSGLWYHIATVDVDNKSVNWGPSTQWMRLFGNNIGVDPSVSVSEGAIVAEVHSVCGTGSSDEIGPLWTTIGKADTASNTISWGPSAQIEDKCYYPSITISRDGTFAVVAYQIGEKGPDIAYRVGTVNAAKLTVDWGPRTIFANGTNVSLSMNDIGNLIAVFNSWQENTGYWCAVGQMDASSTTIHWGPTRSFSDAEIGGKVAIGNWSSAKGSTILTVFPGPKNDGKLMVKNGYGPVTAPEWRVIWDPSGQYQGGVEPGVAIVYQGYYLEVHRSQDINIGRKLWYELQSP